MKQVIDFEYRSKVKIEDDVEVISYNSPYPMELDNQSIDDIKYAIKERKILEDKKGIYEIKFLCRFVENDDGSFDQLFDLKEAIKI
jgi:hypothetical protein